LSSSSNGWSSRGWSWSWSGGSGSSGGSVGSEVHEFLLEILPSDVVEGLLIDGVQQLIEDRGG